MSRKILYIITAAAILLIIHLNLDAQQKSSLFSVIAILLWLGISAFWVWVYVQSRTRRLFVSKVVIMIIALGIGVTLRHTLKILDVSSTLVGDLISASVAAVIAVETWDLWNQSGKKASNVEATEKKEHDQ